MRGTGKGEAYSNSWLARRERGGRLSLFCIVPLTPCPHSLHIWTSSFSRAPSSFAHHARSCGSRPGPQRPLRPCGGGTEKGKRRCQRRRSPARPQGFFFDAFIIGRCRRRRPRCGQVDAPHNVSFSCLLAWTATPDRVLRCRRRQGQKEEAEKRGEGCIPLWATTANEIKIDPPRYPVSLFLSLSLTLSLSLSLSRFLFSLLSQQKARSALGVQHGRPARRRRRGGRRGEGLVRRPAQGDPEPPQGVERRRQHALAARRPHLGRRRRGHRGQRRPPAGLGGRGRRCRRPAAQDEDRLHDRAHLQLAREPLRAR